MDDEVQLISDGDGLAVLRNAAAVDRFLDFLGLLSGSRTLDGETLASALRVGSGAARALSSTAAGVGRWVKLTPDSAQAIRDFGLVTSSTPGCQLRHGRKTGRD